MEPRENQNLEMITGPAQAIVLLLQKQLGLHRQLLDIVRSERQALAAADLSKIQECTFNKENLIEQIRHAESARMREVANLTVLIKRPLKELTVLQLAIEVQVMAPKIADQLRSGFNALTILIQRIREQGDYNRSLIEKSLEHVRKMKQNVLGEAAPKTDVYNTQGQKASASAGARLISTEA